VKSEIALLLIVLLVCCIATPFVSSQPADGLSALKISGTKIVDEKGNIVQLRGANLGSWLVLESHFLGMSFPDERTLWSGLQQRFGKAKMEEIREAFRTAWIGPEDFHNIKQLGLNHVRVPFLATLLESDDALGKYKDSVWKWLDNVVDWSEQAGIYCILDLHGAPGGQSKAEHTGAKDRNELWSRQDFQQRTTRLWQAIALRYKGRKAIAAFDVLNEPMGAPNPRTMLTFQLTLARTIREADPQRLTIIEDGYKGAEHFSPLTGKDKAGIIYSVHVYPTLTAKPPTPERHERHLAEGLPKLQKEQARFRQPLYIGEWNVIQESAGGAPMMARHVEAMRKAGFSWSMWIYKQANPRGVQGLWSLYRNTRKMDMPDFDKDDVEMILRKIRVEMARDRFTLHEPVAKALAE
jgi:endoglucanase